MDIHCVAWDVAPPTIPPSLIRNLGATFCDIDPAQLTQEALTRKKKVSAPGGKKKTLKKKPQGPDNEDTTKDAPRRRSPGSDWVVGFLLIVLAHLSRPLLLLSKSCNLNWLCLMLHFLLSDLYTFLNMHGYHVIFCLKPSFVVNG